MTKQILGFLAVGIIIGILFFSSSQLGVFEALAQWILALLLFAVGIDLGQTSQLRTKLKDMPKHVLLTPVIIALGSICGAVVGGFLIGLPGPEAAAVGSGFGWYSLSAVMIAQIHNVSLGALAFLANVFREVIAFVVIPVIAVRLGKIPAIGPGGATTMDVTLPLIAKETDEETALLAFYSGLVLSLMVPFLVPLFLKLAS